MRDDEQRSQSATSSRISVGGCIGLIVGTLVGAVGMLAWGILAGFAISVGYGLLGLLYLPLIGAIIGGMCGGALGVIVALVLPLKDVQ